MRPKKIRARARPREYGAPLRFGFTFSGSETARFCRRDWLIEEHVQKIVLERRVMDKGPMIFADEDGVRLWHGSLRHACRSRWHGAEQTGLRHRAVPGFEVKSIEVPSDRRIVNVTGFEANLQLSVLLFDQEGAQSRRAIPSQ